MELQTRQSYFKQVSVGMVGFGVGMLIPAADIALGSTVNILALCIFGGALVLSLGIIGWIFTERLVK